MLDPGWLLPPSRDAFRRLVAGFEGQIKIVTFAPELPGALDLVAEIRAIGAVPAIGHTAATFEQATAALVGRAHHVTHLGNAMTGLHHRGPGCVGAALLSGASIELICDGIHLHPAFVRLVVEFLRGRGELHRLSLVTDATAAAGMPDGSYRWGDRDVRLQRGEVRLADGTLAGSALTLDHALRNVVQFANLSLEKALALVTANPARGLGWMATWEPSPWVPGPTSSSSTQNLPSGEWSRMEGLPLTAGNARGGFEHALPLGLLIRRTLNRWRWSFLRHHAAGRSSLSARRTVTG